MPLIKKMPEEKAFRFSKSWLFLAVIVLFVVFVRVRLLDVPLERDEGEYAYMGRLILEGIPPYSVAYNMKFPGTYLMYALIMGLFGQTIGGVHTGLLMVNCAAIILVYFLAKRIADPATGVMAAAAYAVLSLSSSVLGFAAHATHFVVLPALGGSLLLLLASEKEKPYLYGASGLLLGMSVIMKQPGLFFVLFGGTYILLHHFFERKRAIPADIKLLLYKLGSFSLGAVLPIIITLLWISIAGVFDRFWFWTVVYASKYVTQIPISQAFSLFRRNLASVADGFFLLWVLSALGCVAIFIHKGLKVKRMFLFFFALFSFFSVCPGFYFREHYFITLLPAVAILTAISIDSLSATISSFLKPSYAKLIGAGIFITAALIGVVKQEGYLFSDDPVKLSRTIYGGNPFPEALPVAEFIRSRTVAVDKIAVLGSEPEIFFYAQRRSATGYIYTYGLMEAHDFALTMQKEMIEEIESAKPKFIVLVPIDTSWLIRPESEKYIFDWIENYLKRNYTLVGIVDILSPDVTIFKWYDDAMNYTVRSAFHMTIYERK